MEKNIDYSRGTDEAKVINVIVTKSAIGNGTKENPARILYQYWDFNGNLLAMKDCLNLDEQ